MGGPAPPPSSAGTTAALSSSSSSSSSASPTSSAAMTSKPPPPPASRRLPLELVRHILTLTGDWELATALGVRTSLPPSSPWVEFATPLDRAILRSAQSLRPVEYALGHGHTQFTQWGARVLIRFSLIPTLDLLLRHDEAQVRERCSELLPVVASAWGRRDVLEWAKNGRFRLRPDPRTTAEAIDEASRHGQVEMLDFWLESGLPLHYSEAALSSATIKRQLGALEWWKNSGLPLKIGNVLDFASMEGSTVCLDWWSKSGLPCRYSKAALYTLSKSGNIPLLEWWRTSRFPLAYDKEVLVVATRHARTDVLDWWASSGLDVEFRFFDIEEALEDCVADERGKERVQRWWEERGYDPQMGANQWMRLRNLKEEHAYTAELGGKAPIVVFENVNLQMAVNGVAFASHPHLVQSSIFSSFLTALTAKCTSIASRIGSPFEKNSMMGPVISARQLGIVKDLVESARKDGASIVCGGEQMKGTSKLDGHDLGSGYYYPPTLITSTDLVKATSLRIWQEESFGLAIWTRDSSFCKEAHNVRSS
ncbi:hypothetical protein JCM8097_003163 [Rhodosporidiobolus ruineniae]